MAVYKCAVSQNSGFGVEWQVTSKRRAFKEVRARVADGYANDEDGVVCDEKGDALARWTNHNGRAVRVVC